jgi:hypothetical protein
LYLRTFFSLTFCHHGCFVTTDVLSPRMFCRYERFDTGRFDSPDVM